MEPTQPSPDLNPMQSEKPKYILAGIILVMMLLVLVFAAISDARSTSFRHTLNQPLSVHDVWLHAEQLQDQLIRVQGKAEFGHFMTALLCCPQRCDCNETQGMLWLVSENPRRVNIDCAIRDMIEINAPNCQGDECGMTCEPFNPQGVE